MSKIVSKRKLEITAAGYWYLLLTIGFGVVAISSKNNILYVLESLLLASIVISGILSETAVSTLRLNWRRKQGVSEKTAEDIIEITNNRKFPVFCVEIGTFKNKEQTAISFLPFIAANSTVKYSSTQVFEQRGKTSWDGIYIATKFPFGFANKINFSFEPGSRIIWPKAKTLNQKNEKKISSNKLQREPDPTDIKVHHPGESYRDVVWSKSLGINELYSRTRTSEHSLPYFELVVSSTSSAKEFEDKVIQAASVFYWFQAAPNTKHDGMLRIRNGKMQKCIYGKEKILNELAIIKQEAA